MRSSEPDPRQVVQRVRVGLIGLAAVILLIGLAGLLFSALRDDPPAAVGNDVTSAAPANASDGVNEPLADLGVAPGSVAMGNGQ